MCRISGTAGQSAQLSPSGTAVIRYENKKRSQFFPWRIFLLKKCMQRKMHFSVFSANFSSVFPIL
jgi:hypothetical protein